MWYASNEIKANMPIISIENKIELVKDKVYVVKEIFNYGDRTYVTLFDQGDKKYGISFFRNLLPEEEIPYFLSP